MSKNFLHNKYTIISCKNFMRLSASHIAHSQRSTRAEPAQLDGRLLCRCRETAAISEHSTGEPKILWQGAGVFESVAKPYTVHEDMVRCRIPSHTIFVLTSLFWIGAFLVVIKKVLICVTIICVLLIRAFHCHRVRLHGANIV